MNKVSVIIITRNEEDRLQRCLEAVKGFDEVVVIDSESTDKTADIARRYTDRVFTRKFDDFSSQKNFGLSKCRNDWALSIDADELVTEKLKHAIADADLSVNSGFRIKRVTYIFGRLLRYGGHGRDFPLRLFDKNKGGFVQPIHEFADISGKIGIIKEPLAHYSSGDLDEYMKKLNFYTDLEADLLVSGKASFSYARLCLRPVLRFLQRYVLQAGFLDGGEGFAFYSLSGLYDFVKQVKFWEKIKGKR